MNHGDKIQILYQYAAGLKLAEFDALFEETAASLPEQERGEAYLMRAQIKLLSSDASLMDDLAEAERAGAAPRHPCLADKWPVETPNRFIVFPAGPGALAGFVGALPAAGEKLGRWYGHAGETMVRQVLSAACYFTGGFLRAIQLEKGRGEDENESPTARILSQCILFRSYLATGRPNEAEAAMLETIRLSDAYPDCIGSYLAFRQWANLTTGWNGENPRFYDGPDGKPLPFFEDRAKALREGISHPPLSEEPFVAYATRHIEKPGTLRDFYVELFHAMYWFQAGDVKQAESWFLRLYQVAENSGVFVPFIEYGRQVIPLLQHMRESGAPCAPEWLEMVISLSRQYEDSLDKYRT